jgi:hypothetical protein
VTALLAWLRKPGTRGYLYRVAAAAGLLLVAYGVVDAERLALWTGLVAVLFAVPAYNTPTTAQRRARGEDT